MLESVLPMFYSRSLIGSGLTFRSFTHFEFIFVYGVRKCSSFILLQVVDQFSQHHLLKDCLFSIVYSFLKNFILFKFTILYWFCHISKWICHRYTCVPHPEPSSLLRPHTIPLGCPSALAPSIHYRASNLVKILLYRFQMKDGSPNTLILNF